MITIPPINQTKLSDLMVEAIRYSLLNSLEWLEFSYPAAKKRINDTGDVWPSVYSSNGTLTELCLKPENTVKSFCFFEKRGYNVSKNQNNEFNLSLIFWGNLLAIDNSKTYDYTDELISNVCEVLKAYTDSDLNVSLDNPFSEYSGVNEENSQFLFYPYFGFKIDFSVYGSDCQILEQTIIPIVNRLYASDILNNSNLPTELGENVATALQYLFDNSGGGSGSGWLHGIGTPGEEIGTEGNYYLQTDNGSIWYKGETWSELFNIYTYFGIDTVSGDTSKFLNQKGEFENIQHSQLTELNSNVNYLHVSDSEKSVWNAKQNDLTGITKEPTGFDNPKNVVVTANGNRTITLTGTFNAYYRGILNSVIISGYTSPLHDSDTSKKYMLTYNGTDYAWRDLSIYTDFFSDLLVCFTFYDTTNNQWVYTREPHGLMQWQSHLHYHETIGTYLRSGGDLSNFTLNSNTATNRRPLISITTIVDEDIDTSSPALTTNNYTWFFLSGASVPNFSLNNSEIINLIGNQPYYNQFVGAAWQQTLFPVNAYGKIFIFAIPVTSDNVSQQYRYVFVQPQTVSTTLTTIQNITANSLNLGGLSTILPEFVFIGEIIIRYTAGNWVLISTTKLTGTRTTQISTPTGNFLSAVTTDGFFSGSGTATDPLTAEKVKGGTTEQILVKNSNADYDLKFVDNLQNFLFCLNFAKK